MSAGHLHDRRRSAHRPRVRTSGTTLPWAALTTVVLLALAILFGGASRSNALRIAVIQLAALPVLVIAIEAFVKADLWPRHRFAMTLVGSALAIPLIQLIPLPPALWTGLPGRDAGVLALELTGLAPGWSPLSLTPDQTWAAFLGLLAPAAVFVAVLTLEPIWRRRLIWIVLAGSVAGIVLAALQGATGGARALYPWDWTSSEVISGLFANRNHLATFCAATLPLAAVLAASAFRQSQRRGQPQGGMPPAVWLGLLYVVLMVIALGAVRSRAGILLLPIAMALGLLAAWVASGRGRPSPVLLALTAGGAAAVLALGIFAIVPIMAAFDTGGEAEGRFEDWPTVIQAAQAYLPVGSGLGSFDPVYRSFEPLQRLDATYFNQAHNDYLEILLETGWFGMVALGGFLVWFARRSWTAWTAPAGGDGDLARAGGITVLVILLHSGADYPLRTMTISVLFALCCALLELGRATPGSAAKRADTPHSLAKADPSR
jgi:O-antigen ligase